MRRTFHLERSFDGDIAVSKALLFASLTAIFIAPEPLMVFCGPLFLVSGAYHVVAMRAQMIEHMHSSA